MIIRRGSQAVRVPSLGRIALAFGILGVAAGCTATQVSTVVKDIGIYVEQAEPIIIALVPVITALSSTLGDAPSSASLHSFEEEAQADLTALSSLCNDYATTPDATVFGQIGGTVDKLVAESDGALLQVLAIKDPVTRERLQLAIAGFDAIIHTIDGLVQTTQSTTAVAAKAHARAIKLRQVAASWSEQDRAAVARAFGTNFDLLLQRESGFGL